MNTNNRLRISTAAITLTGTLLLSGCSGENEDPRITLCKNLTTALTNTTQEVSWQEPQIKFKSPEFAAITVAFTGNSATCYYEYDNLEDTAMHLAEPILAYATLPYAMTLNGQELPKQLVTQVTSDEQIRQGKATAERVQQVAEQAASQAKKTAGQASELARKATAEATEYAQKATAEATEMAKQAAQDASAYVKEQTDNIKQQLNQ